MFRQLDTVFEGGIKDTTEAEVTFLVTETRFDYVVQRMQEDDFPVESTKVTDINYTKDSKTVYRISTDVKPNLVNLSATALFAELAKDHPVMVKKRIETIDDLKISDESMLKSKPKLSDKARAIIREKERYTQVVYDVDGFVIKIEATNVSSGAVYSKLDKKSYEVEIELTSEHTVKVVPPQVVSTFAATIDKVQQYIDDDIHSTAEEGTQSGEVWVKDNRIGFLSWIYKTFKDQDSSASAAVETDDFCNKKPGAVKMELFPHQKFIREYLHHDTPYRGLLLYHGLGVGKTCASIAAAEGFIAHNKKVIVMVPASLVSNYREEIKRCASLGNPETKSWSLIDASSEEVQTALVDMGIAPKLIKKSVWVPFAPAGLEDFTIHSDKTWKELSATERISGLAVLGSIIDSKYHFIPYNGLTTKSLAALGKTLFDDAFVVIDEAHNFISRVVNGRSIARTLYERMMYSKGTKIALLSGTPIINHPFELALTLNLVRGPMIQYTLKSMKLNDIETMRAALSAKNLLKYVDVLTVNTIEKTVTFSLHPGDFVQSESGGIIREPWTMSTKVIKDSITDVLSKQNKSKGKVEEKLHLAYPNDQKEFERMFLDISDPDNPRITNIDSFTRRAIGTVSYFKSTNEAHFPTVLPRNIERIGMADYQFMEYTKKRDSERKMESSQRRAAATGGVFGAKNSVYRAFSRMACNFVFPETMTRPFPKDLKKAAQREVDALEDDTEEEKRNVKKVATKKDIDTEYNDKLNKLMTSLKKQAPTLLSPKALHDLYSPKMEQVYSKVATSAGKILMYSQFRSIEGLGVLKLILDSRGYIEVQVSQNKTGVWSITNSKEVMKPQYNGKRYITFDTDRAKSNVLLQMFNDDPDTPQALKHSNLRGEFIKMITVTQSGAEGISLKNVRHVLILEPFWNMVRMEQVVGRAVRTCSHNSLPAAERTVEVSIFCSVFTPEQLKREFTLRTLDKGMSSDMHILQLAEKKDTINQTFLNHLKVAAVDCRTNAASMQFMKSGMQCYAFPISSDPADFSYRDDISADKRNNLESRRRIQGKVVSLRGKKYVQVDDIDSKVLYDYNAYKHAGVLEPAEIE